MKFLVFATHSNISQILGHVANMQCRASSDPNVPYEIRWYHEGRLINAANSFR